MTELPATAIAVYLLEDSPHERDVIERILAATPDMRLVGMHSQVRPGLDEILAIRPEIVVLDLDFCEDELDGLWALRQIHDRLEEEDRPRCVIYSNYTPLSQKWRWFAEAFRYGAWGYCRKEASVDPLLSIIRDAQRGIENFHGVPGDLLTQLRRNQGGTPADLSGQQKKVCWLLADGRNTQQIAICLDRGDRWVRTLSAAAARRLGCKSVGDLIRHLHEIRFRDHYPEARPTSLHGGCRPGELS